MRLRDLDDTVIECRTLHHAWERIPDRGGQRRKFQESRSVARVMFRCLRGCGTVRLEAWNKLTGERLGSASYEYDGAYHIDSWNDPNLNKKLRKEFMQRSDIVAQHVEQAAAAKRPRFTVKKAQGRTRQLRKVS